MEHETKEKESGLPLRLFRCEESSEYAKRVMAQIDIDFSLKCLIRLREMNNSNNTDDLVRKALWNTVIIRLVSVFNGPNALKLQILDELPKGAREAYRFFDNYRDKHIAHNANPFDQIKPGVILSDADSGKKEVLGVANIAMKEASFVDPEFVDSLGKLITALLKQINKERELWSGRTLEQAKKRQIDDLYKLPPLQMVVPSSSYLHKGNSSAPDGKRKEKNE